MEFYQCLNLIDSLFILWSAIASQWSRRMFFNYSWGHECKSIHQCFISLLEMLTESLQNATQFFRSDVIQLCNSFLFNKRLNIHQFDGVNEPLCHHLSWEFIPIVYSEIEMLRLLLIYSQHAWIFLHLSSFFLNPTHVEVEAMELRTDNHKGISYFSLAISHVRGKEKFASFSHLHSSSSSWRC